MLRNCIFQAIMEPSKNYIILIILHVEVLRVSFKLLFDCPTAISGLSSTGQPHSSYANHCSFTFLTTKVLRRLVMKLSIRHHELVNKEFKRKQNKSKANVISLRSSCRTRRYNQLVKENSWKKTFGKYKGKSRNKRAFLGSKRTQGHLQPHFRTRVLATSLLTPKYVIIAYTPLTNCKFITEFKSFNPIQDGLFWSCSQMGGRAFLEPPSLKFVTHILQ